MPAIVLALGIVGLVGCAPRGAPPRATLGAQARIAVLPFRAGAVLGPRAEVQPAPAGSAVPEAVGEVIAHGLAERLARTGLSIVRPEAVVDAVPPGGSYDPPLAARVARRLGADLAVLGAVARYRQRVGSAWAVEQPASVAYEAALVRGTDAAVLQLARFDYTQQALSENLLDLPRFLRGRGRWLTREEILDGALDETAARFAGAVRSGLPAR